MIPTEQFLDALSAAVVSALADLKPLVRQVVREELETAFRELARRLDGRDAEKQNGTVVVTRPCPECGGLIGKPPSRSDRQTCSDACRSKAYRRRRDAKAGTGV
jgi:predicted nucleic acid-binding Zn ribbon protein